MKRTKTLLLVGLGVVPILFIGSCGAGTPSGPCFLFLTNSCGDADEIKVIADGKTLGTFTPPRDGGHDVRRITFQSKGKIHLTFEIRRKGKLIYRPEFDISPKRGDMLQAQFRPANKKPTGGWGPPPTGSFPALAEGVPAKVWCWFEPANRRSDYVIVVLTGREVAAEFKKRAADAGYRILRQKHPDRFRVAPPKGKTIVEAVLELEKWKEVKKIEFALARIY